MTAIFRSIFLRGRCEVSTYLQILVLDCSLSMLLSATTTIFSVSLHSRMQGPMGSHEHGDDLCFYISFCQGGAVLIDQ